MIYKAKHKPSKKVPMIFTTTVDRPPETADGRGRLWNTKPKPSKSEQRRHMVQKADREVPMISTMVNRLLETADGRGMLRNILKYHKIKPEDAKDVDTPEYRWYLGIAVSTL